MTRSSIVLVALAAALAATLGWLVVERGEGRAAERSASGAPTAHARSARPAAVPPAPGPSTAAPAAAPQEAQAAGASPARVELREEGLADGPWLAGRVVLPPGAPAGERAWVVVTCPSKDDEKEESARAAVGADGAFRVALPPIETRALVSLDARTLYLERAVSLTAEQAREPLVLEPALGGWIEGTFAPPPGEDPAQAAAGLAGSTLAWYPTARRAWSRPPPHEIEGLAFELHGIPPGADVHLTFSSERYYLQPFSFPRVAAGERAALTLALGTAATVEGRVQDESGLPRGEVKVTATARSRSSTRKATTAEDGTYRVSGLPPAPVSLRFEAGQFQQTQRDVVLARDGEVRSGVDVVLPRGETIEGRVLWPDGRPAAAALTVVDETKPYLSLDAPTETDGTFRIGGSAGASYRVTAQASPPSQGPDEEDPAGSPPWNAALQGVRAGTKDVVLTLAPSLAIAGTVRDDRGEPLDDFWIQAWPGQDARAVWGGHAACEQRVSGAGGRFELRCLQPGPWIVQASRDELVTSPRTPVEVKDGTVLDLVVPRPAVIEGEVLDASGRGVPGAVLTLNVTDDTISLGLERVADAAGRFRLEVTGRIDLRASAPSYASSELVELDGAPGASESVTLTLRRGGRITGEVVDASGRGLAGSAVSVWGEGEYRSLTSDAQGAFVLEAVTPGHHVLSAAPSPEEILARLGPDADANAQRLLQHQAQVDLAGGEERHVVLRPPELQPVRVRGTVSCSGRPLGEATLFCTFGRRHATAKANAEGGYELTVPAPGRYQVTVMHDSSGLNGMLEVDVPARESLALDIALAGGTIRGRVRGPDGPLAGISVRAMPAMAPRFAPGLRVAGGSGTSGEDGRYELLVPIGTYIVTAPGPFRWGMPSAGRPSYCSATVEGVQVTDGGEARGVDFELRMGGSIEGRVLGGSGAALIAASDAQGGMLSSTYTDGESFRIDGLPPGPVTLRAQVRDEEHVALPVTVEVVAGATSTAELRVVPATRLEVRVRDASGAPAAVASASLETADGPVQTAGASEPGLVRLGPWPAGRYTLRVRVGARELVHEVQLGGEPATTVELRAE